MTDRVSTDEERRRFWKLVWLDLPKYYEHFFTVDQYRIWRRHLVWSKENGQYLRNLMTQRFATNSVLLSLLVSAEIGILYSPSKPADLIRFALKDNSFDTVEFWTGLIICFSILLSICALYTNFTAWSIVSSISDANSHALLRSSLGLYATQTPSNLVVSAIYSFFLTMTMSLFVIVHWTWATGITSMGFILIFHVNSTYSAFGRVILETGAMGEERVFSQEEEEKLDPNGLHEALLSKVTNSRTLKIPVNEQYRINFQGSLRSMNSVNYRQQSTIEDKEKGKN